MLIYVESKVFPSKTFVLLINHLDTIARARAHMLHILYELGKSDHQFRFRFKGTYLRDAYTFEDYKILDSSVIRMVPMAKSRREIFLDSNVLPRKGRTLDEIDKDSKKKNKDSLIDEVQVALFKEVEVFDRRETFIAILRVLLWIHFLAIFLSLVTVYPYSCTWVAAIAAYGFWFCPKYTRISGYVGGSSISKEYFLVTFFFGMLINLSANITMGVFLLQDAIQHGCAEFKGDCSHMNIWSIICYLGHGLFLVMTMLLIVVLYFNFKVEVGDIIEYFLVQNKDVTKVLRLAKMGRLKERRNAAFELASLAATGEDAKKKIVDHEGLQVLMTLALCSDETTQEYATEALAELLTISQIQDQFIEIGGARILCALLHSNSQRLLNEAVMAISYIVADSDTNKHALVSEDGLYDVASAVKKATPQARQIIAGIYLELSFNSEIRGHLSSDSISASALVSLVNSRDDETKRLALQTLELLAIENPVFVVNRDELLTYLIDMPFTTADDQLCLLSGKILLYYAETAQTCEKLIGQHGFKDSLLQLAYNPDPVLQNVVAKIILATLENCENRQDVLAVGIIEVLAYLHDNCQDREAWEMAEKAIDTLHGFTMKIKKNGSQSSSDQPTSSGVGSSSYAMSTKKDPIF